MPMKLKSRTIIKSRTMPERQGHSKDLVGRRLPRHRPPTRPGEMLLEEFVKPLAITQSELASRLGISFPRLNEIIRGKRTITSDTALRLARVLGMSQTFGLGYSWIGIFGMLCAVRKRLRSIDSNRCAPRPNPLLSFLMVACSRGMTLVLPLCGRQARPFYLFTIPIRGQTNCPLLRASSDHRFIVGALRARRIVVCPTLFLDRHRYRNRLQGIVEFVSGGGDDRVYYFHASKDFAEDGVGSVQPAAVIDTDIEL